MDSIDNYTAAEFEENSPKMMYVLENEKLVIVMHVTHCFAVAITSRA